MLTLYATVYVCMREWISHESRSLWPPRQANGGQLLLVTKPWSHVLKWKVKLFFSRLVLMTTQRAIRFSSIQQKQSLVCNFNWISRIWNFMPIFFLLSSLNRFKEKNWLQREQRFARRDLFAFTAHTLGQKIKNCSQKTAEFQTILPQNPTFYDFKSSKSFEANANLFSVFCCLSLSLAQCEALSWFLTIHFLVQSRTDHDFALDWKQFHFTMWKCECMFYILARGCCLLRRLLGSYSGYFLSRGGF